MAAREAIAGQQTSRLRLLSAPAVAAIGAGGTVLEAAAIAVLGVVALLILCFALLPPLFGRHVLVVTSGSMEPLFSAGDAVLVERIGPESAIAEGDLIAFHTFSAGALNTHRVVGTKVIANETYFQTKGDANQAADPDLVARSAVYGRVERSFHAVGYLLAAVNNPGPRALLFFLPAVFLAAQELLLALAGWRRLGPSLPSA
jgi:signal peptidase